MNEKHHGYQQQQQYHLVGSLRLREQTIVHHAAFGPSQRRRRTTPSPIQRRQPPLRPPRCLRPPSNLPPPPHSYCWNPILLSRVTSSSTRWDCPRHNLDNWSNCHISFVNGTIGSIWYRGRIVHQPWYGHVTCCHRWQRTVSRRLQQRDRIHSPQPNPW